MGDLNPKGLEFEIGGVKRRLLFTLNVIDEIQSHYDLPIYEALKKLTVPKEQASALRYVLTVLLNDEYERESASGKENLLKELSEKEVGWILDVADMGKAVSAIINAYSGAIPKGDKDEDDDPKPKSGKSRKSST